jgi:transmembrane sensor
VNAPGHSMPLANAQDIGARAAQWLEQRERGNFGPSEQAAFEAWLEESLAHRTAYWRVNAAWERANRLSALGTRHDVPPASSKRIGARFSILKRVAVLGVLAVALGAGASAYLSLFYRPSALIYSTTVGGHRIIALADGSAIELNTDTVLRIDGADHRKIWLDKGEAYFNIRHDAVHPFVVMANNHRVTDLGTKFFIREDANRLEVALLEGRASLQAVDGKEKAQILTPGHLAVATADLTSVTVAPSSVLTGDLGWRNGVLVFRRMTLADAASEFNRYNQKKLVVLDPIVANAKIDGTFPANNVEAFLDAVQATLRVHVEDLGNEAVISH